MTTLQELEHLGVCFVSLTEALDLTTPAGRAMAGLLSVFSEFPGISLWVRSHRRCPEEQALSRYYYLENKIRFPFQAKCRAAKVVSPLKKGETVEVVSMAPDEVCAHDMLVLVRWQRRKVAVPLSQLTDVAPEESTDKAIGDWHYWVAQGLLSLILRTVTGKDTIFYSAEG